MSDDLADQPHEPGHPGPPRWQRTSWRVWTLILVGVLALAIGEWNERRSDSGRVREDPSAQRVDWTGGSSSSASGGSSSSASQSAEETYLRQIRRELSVTSVSDSALLSAGRETCRALDRGVSPVEVFVMSNETDGGAIMAVAASTLCREHLPAVQEFAWSITSITN